MNAILRKLVGYVGLFMSLALASQAGQYWWSGNGATLGGSGTWDTSAYKWRDGSESGSFTNWPNGADEAIFTNSSGTVTVSGAVNVNKLTFYVNSCTVAGDTLNLTGSNPAFTKLSGTDGSWELINSPMSGSSDLTLVGSGSWRGRFQFQGNNSNFTGKIVLTNSIELAFTNDFNLGRLPASFIVDALISRGASFRSPTSAYRPTINVNRGINNLGGITVLGGIAFNSAITGPGGVTFRSDGLGSVLGSSANDYAGTTQIYTDSGSSTYLMLGVDNAVPHGAGKGNLDLKCWGAGTVRFDLNGKNVVINGLTTSGSGSYYNNCVVDNASAGGVVTLTLGDGNATGNNYYGRIINTTGTLNLTKIGTGTQTLNGTNAYSGITSVNGGTLLIDQNYYTNGTLGELSLGGGTLSLNGGGLSTNSLQTFGNVTFTAGGNGITLANRGGNATLALGNTWTRNAGATLIATLQPVAGGVTLSSSPTLQNDILGYAFVRDNTGVDFATVSGGNVVRYVGATVLNASSAAADLSSTVNYILDTDRTLTGASTTQTVNSIRLNNASLSLGSKVLVVGSGGIIFSNTTWKGISSGTVTAGGSDLVIYAGFIGGDQHFLSSAIADNGGPVGVTIAGGANISLSGANTFSGDTVINGGVIKGLGKIPYGNGKGNLLINSGGYADLHNGSAQLNGLSQSPGNTGGPINSSWGANTRYLTVGNGNATASFSGSISDGNGGGYVVFIKVGNGIQTLSGANTYRGGTILSNGVLSVSSTNNIGGVNAKVTFAGGTLRITGTNFTGFGATPVTVSGNVGLDIVEASNAFTFTNDVLGTLTKTGNGSLAVSGSVASLVTDNRTLVSGSGSVANWTLKSLTGGAYTPAGIEAVTGTLTLDGNYTFDLNTDGTGDKLTATGAVTMNSIVITISVPANLTDKSKVYTLVQGSSLGGSASLASVLPQDWKLKKEGNALVVRYVSPGTMISIL